jgi:hypothetical protein
MIPRLAQVAAQYKNTLVVAIVVVGAALADGVYSSGAAAAFGVACWWLIFAVLALRLGPLESTPRWALLAGGTLLAFAALTLISIGWADDDGGAYRAAVLAFLYTGLFTLVVITSRRGSIGSWLAGLAIGLAGVCVLALATRWFPGIHHDEVTHALPDTKGRLNYPIGYWNALGSALALLVALLGWLAVSARSALWRSIATGFLVLPVLGIFLTSSRGAVIAAVLGLLVLLAAIERRSALLGALLIAAPGCAVAILVADAQGTTSGSEGTVLLAVTLACAVAVGALRRLADAALERLALPRTIGRAALAVALIVVAIAAVAANPSERWDHFKALPAPSAAGNGFAENHLASGSGSGRYQFWSTALDAFDEKPALGIGAGGYEAWWTSHGTISFTVRNAHSLFFETMAELGLIGLLLIVGFLAASAAAGIVRLRAGPRAELAAALAVLAAGVLSAGIDWTWQLPAVVGVVIVITALLTGPAGLPVGEGASEERSARRWTAGRAVAALASLLIVAGCGIQLLSSLELDHSQSRARSGDLPAAADAARTASAIEPWSAGPYLQLALVQEQAGDLAGAIDSIRRAADHDSEDWAVWLVRARLEAKQGNTRAAQAALARSRALNPRSPVFTFLPASG